MIRLARQNDVLDIGNILLQVHDVHQRIRPDLFKKGMRKYSDEDLVKIINDSSKPIFVYEENNKIIGYCFCNIQITKDVPSLFDRKSLYIDDLCVDIEFRNKHIGKSLFEYVKKYATDNDFDSITLNVWEGNDAALNFYKNVGLKPLKTTMEMKI